MSIQKRQRRQIRIIKLIKRYLISFIKFANMVSPTFMEAIKKAQQNITEFHEAQQEKSWYIRRDAGVTLGQQVRPIDRVGIYIPGGKAAYPSTVLMNAIPAKIAGVQDVAIT